MLKNFKDENPGVDVVLCPAVIVFRTTPGKQHLTITQLELNHDHDPFDPPRLEKYKSQVVGRKIIRRNDVKNNKNDIESSHPSSVIDSSNEQQVQATNLDLSNDEASSGQLQITDGSIDNVNIIGSVPIVIDEDFDCILSKLEINISSTINKDDRERKISRIKKMNACFETNNNKFEIQPEDTGTSLSTVGALSIHLSRARGRARGRKNCVIGRPAYEPAEKLKSFEQLTKPQQKIYVFKLIFTDKNMIKRVLIDNEKISKVDLKHLDLKSIPDALASDSIELESTRDYFERDAFDYINKLIKGKRQSDYWTCKTCKNELGTGNSVECGKCLFWSHWACVDLVEEPESYWSCPKGC